MAKDKVVCWVAAVAVATIVLVGQPTAAVTIHFVDDDATGGKDGSSWINAFADLQDALAAAQAGSEIRVAQGTYRPADPDGDHDATFQLTDKVIVKGGYAGPGEPNPNKRDIHKYKTILSGDLNGDDTETAVTDLLEAPSRSENSRHVVTGSGTDSTAVLDGFTISGGNADATYSNDAYPRAGRGGGDRRTGRSGYHAAGNRSQ